MEHSIGARECEQPTPHDIRSALLAKLSALDELDLKGKERQKEREKLQGLLISRSANHTSIYGFPHELIQHIFLLCHTLDTDDDTLPYFKPHESSTPLSVSQVCSFWRKVALSTPELWATIAFRGPKDIPYPKQWLKRTGPTHGLTMFYHSVFHGCPYDLTKISHQIHRLHLHILDSKRHAKLLLADPRFDSLKELTITVPSKPFSQIPTDPLVPMRHAPCLRKLKLDLSFTFSRPLGRFHFLFPWSQLTSLSLSQIHWSKFPALLSLCVNVHTGYFGVDIGGAWEGNLVHPDPVAEDAGTIDNLQSLTLSLNDYLFPAVVHGLSFGNLRFLSLENTEELYRRTWTHWVQPGHFFLQLRNLETLVFKHHTAELVNLLRHAPKLQNLTICAYQPFEPIFNALTLEADDPGNNVLPNLTRLELQPLHKALAGSTSFIRMLHSRLRVTALPSYLPLERCNLWIDQVKSDEVGLVKSWEKEIEETLGPEATQVFRCCPGDTGV